MGSKSEKENYVYAFRTHYCKTKHYQLQILKQTTQNRGKDVIEYRTKSSASMQNLE